MFDLVYSSQEAIQQIARYSGWQDTLTRLFADDLISPRPDCGSGGAIIDNSSQEASVPLKSSLKWQESFSPGPINQRFD